MPRKKENAETALRIGVIRNPKNPKELIVEGSRVGGSGVSEHRIKEATVYVGSPRKATENELADAARSLRNHAAIIPSWVDDCMAHYGPNAAMHPDAGQERVSALWYALAIRGCRDEINRNIDLGFP